jgi:hypothetical protein
LNNQFVEAMYHRSSIAKSSNVYSVRLPESLQLDAEDFCRISAVHPDSFDGGSYIIDFFDQRDALRYLQRAEEMFAGAMADQAYDSAAYASMMPEDMLFPPGLEQASEEMPLPPGLDHIPTPFKNEMSALKTKKKKAPQAKGQVVHIQGLPENLLKEVMISAMMDQAKLDEKVVSIDVHSYKKQGAARITFVSEIAADECVRHCNGQKWNPMGPPVTAFIVSTDVADSSRSARGAAGKAKSKLANAQKSEQSLPSWLRSPAYVHSVLTEDAPDKKMTTNSDASTTVSDSDVDDERRQASKTAVWLAC